MSGPKYRVNQPVPPSHRQKKKPQGYSHDTRYAEGINKTACGRKTRGVWALHATRGWKKRA